MKIISINEESSDSESEELSDSFGDCTKITVLPFKKKNSIISLEPIDVIEREINHYLDALKIQKVEPKEKERLYF